MRKLSARARARQLFKFELIPVGGSFDLPRCSSRRRRDGHCCQISIHYVNAIIHCSVIHTMSRDDYITMFLGSAYCNPKVDDRASLDWINNTLREMLSSSKRSRWVDCVYINAISKRNFLREAEEWAVETMRNDYANKSIQSMGRVVMSFSLKNISGICPHCKCINSITAVQSNKPPRFPRPPPPPAHNMNCTNKSYIE